MQTHENYLAQIAALAIDLADLNPTERAHLQSIKLVYGSGPAGTRGVTFFNRWKTDTERPFVEISAFGQESVVQLAGTTVHELGHVLAGWQAGHGKDWRSACERLGLRKILAGGRSYKWVNFLPKLRAAITALEVPSDGQPVCSLAGMFAKPVNLKPCGAGIGTRGGKSRGAGSGSRLRLWSCGCGCKVRVSSDTFEAVHTPCGEAFVKV